MKIIEVDHSLANRFSNYIEINKNLRKYPDLYQPILAHELEHSDEAWSYHDFKLDFFSRTGVNYLQLIKFMFKHPKSFLQLSPVIYSKEKGISIDINIMIMYTIFILVFSLTIWFGVNYL